MDLKKLGHSAIDVTPMAFGAWAIAGWMWGGTDERDALKAVRKAYDLGITTIDTAPVYGFGRSERLVSEALRGIPRDRYQLLTKYGLNWKTEQGFYRFTSEDREGNPVPIYAWAVKERVKKECEDSLRRLKTDYIDLYQIHWPDPSTPIAETMEAVAELLEEGKIRAAGVCNYSLEQVEEALRIVPLASNQIPYSLINRKNEKNVIPQAIGKGMGILPYSPLQRGLLTGKIKPGHQFTGYDTRKGNPFFDDENIRRTHVLLDRIRPIAEAHDATLAQLVINWTVRQKGMGSVLVGARNEQQVIDNAGALAFTLSEDEIDAITRASEAFSLA